MSRKPAKPIEMNSSIPHHHYDFGHVVLREACSYNPMAFFQALASPGKEEFLDNLWRATCERCDENGPASFSYKDVAIDSLLLEEYPTILVTMPSPRVRSEAFYIAIVLQIPMDQIVAGNIPEEPPFGYYTLELGIDPNDGKHTVLCAWDGETHLTLGKGPVAEPSAFLQTVSEKLGSSMK